MFTSIHAIYMTPYVFGSTAKIQTSNKMKECYDSQLFFIYVNLLAFAVKHGASIINHVVSSLSALTKTKNQNGFH